MESFQTALPQIKKLDRFKENKTFLAGRNDLAFVVSDVQFANCLKNRHLNLDKNRWID
jgi:hypothetical protein